MELRFLVGGAGAGKSTTLYQMVIAASIREPDTRFFVIAPEQFTLQTQKELILMHPNRGSMNIDVLSFVRLAFRVLEETGENRRIILEDTGKSMIVKKVLLAAQKELVQFGGSVRKHGFVKEMKSVLSELFQYSIDEAKLCEMEEAAAERPALARKLRDIRTVYTGFRAFLRERYMTADEVLEVLAQVIDRSGLVRDAVFYFDGFTGFTPSQYAVLAVLLRRARAAYVTATIDPRVLGRLARQHQLFFSGQQMMEKLTRLNAQAGGTCLEDLVLPARGERQPRFLESAPLAALEQNLFRYPYTSYEEPQEDIQLWSAADAVQEVNAVACEIRRLIREQGWRYQEIAVVTGDIGTYQPLLERAFAQLSLPCFIDHKRDILANPAVELIQAVVDAAETNLSYESMFRYLKCGLSGCEQDDIDCLENYCIACGIRGKRWEEEWSRQPRNCYPFALDRLNALRQSIMERLLPILACLKNRTSTVQERTEALLALLTAHEVREKLLLYAKQYETEPLKEREYKQVYRCVTEVLARMAELLGADVISLREFREILVTGFQEAKVGLIPPGMDQIMVGDIERTRLMNIKALFFVGVNEGVVPQAPSGKGLLSEPDRRLLSERSFALAPTKREAAYTADFYLYLTLTKPSRLLYLSYRRLDAAGRELRPAALINTVQRLFPRLSARVLARTVSQPDLLLGTDGGMTALADAVRERAGLLEQPPLQELFALYLRGSAGTAVAPETLLAAAFPTRREPPLSEAAVRKLYGNVLTGSVSCLERYAACAFAHFLSYGLRLKERQEYKVAMPDIGTVYHNALELFSAELDKSEYTWKTVPADERRALARQCIQEAARQYGGGVFENTRRSAYLVTRVEQVMEKTVETICDQIRAGSFEPRLFEQDFFYADRYLNLRGRVDRVDLYQDGGRLYYRVVDYKSGVSAFDLTSLYYGLQLQLSVYMNAARRLLQETYPAETLVPAGMFYYGIQDPIVERSEQAEAEQRKALRMDGLVNKSGGVIPLMDAAFAAADGGLRPQTASMVIPVETKQDGALRATSSAAEQGQIESVLGYVTETMHRFSEEIMAGEVEKNPYRLEGRQACTYCAFQSMCGFDRRINGQLCRRLERLDRAAVYEAINEAVGETAAQAVVGAVAGNEAVGRAGEAYE